MSTSHTLERTGSSLEAVSTDKASVPPFAWRRPPSLPAKPQFGGDAPPRATSRTSTPTSKRSTHDVVDLDTEEELTVAPPDPSLIPPKGAPPRLIVILEQACLETYQTPRTRTDGWRTGSFGGKPGGGGGGGRGSYGDGKLALLNCDDHQSALAKMGRDIAQARPDITHQCLLTLLDSPINKAGRLQVYIHTAQGVWIEVNPRVRIPRTFKRFSGLMVQLLDKGKICSQGSEDEEDRLLTVISNPIPEYLPPQTHKITLTHNAPVQRLSRYVPTIPANHSLAVFVGAMAHGQDDFADLVVDEKISISEYSLSASVACGKVR